MKGKLPLVLSVTALVVAVLGSTGPAVAHGVRHALFAHNAGKVDGKHAVGASASAAERSGKLVAANAQGRLPDSEKVDGLDSAAFQRRVTGLCAPGSSLREVNADGTVVCETDDGNAYSAGDGLSLSGVEFALSSLGCEAGEGWEWTGSAWSCDADDDTSYTAGEGLSLSGTQFSLSTSGCQDGDVWKRAGAGWSCEADEDTAYSASGALTQVGNDFRVSSGGCTTGEGWEWTGSEWSCDPDNDTTYTAGNGLALSNGQFRLADSGCTAGEVWKYDGSAWACDADEGAIYDVADGISISGTTIGLASTACAAGEGWEWTGSAWSCDPDNDSLGALACSDDELVKYLSGSWTCATDEDHVGDGSTVVTNGDGTLSVGAVSSTNITNEAAASAGSPATGNVTTTAGAKASASITAPGAGYLVIVSQATFNAPALTTPASISAELKDAGTSVESWTWDPGDADGALDLEQTHTSFVTLASGGAHTYELWLSAPSGSTPFAKARVVVQYFPTNL